MKTKMRKIPSMLTPSRDLRRKMRDEKSKMETKMRIMPSMLTPSRDLGREMRDVEREKN